MSLMPSALMSEFSRTQLSLNFTALAYLWPSPRQRPKKASPPDRRLGHGLTNFDSPPPLHSSPACRSREHRTSQGTFANAVLLGLTEDAKTRKLERSLSSISSTSGDVSRTEPQIARLIQTSRESRRWAQQKQIRTKVSLRATAELMAHV